MCIFNLTDLEVEIKFKLARSAESSLIGFVGVENLLVGSTSISDFEPLKQLPLDPEARKNASCRNHFARTR